jgi:hypothetical protein
MNFANGKLVLSALGVALLATPASAQYYYAPQYPPAYTYVPQYAPAYTYVPAPVYAVPAPVYRAYTYVPAPVYAPPPYGYGPGYTVTYVPVYPPY